MINCTPSAPEATLEISYEAITFQNHIRWVLIIGFLCWIPSHIGIRGNEADMAAKESLNQDITASQVPYTDLKSHINHFISSKWQERWSSCRDNKLFQIKPTLSEWPPGFRRSRKEEVVLSWLRISHTYFSHS